MKKRLFLAVAILASVFSYSCKGSDDPNNNNNGGGNNGGGSVVDIKPDKANARGEKIFYEIFVRSFADSDGDGIGDFNGVTAKLDYLVSLGVEGIWLMPINPSPSYHGYDVMDYTDVNSDYGTMADFDNLVAEAKAKGIDIVLDFVINHTSQEHPWFKNSMTAVDAEFRNYYTYEHMDEVKAKCEAGEVAMVDDNIYNAGIWRAPWGETSTRDYRYIGQFDGSMPDLNYGRVPNLNPVYYEILDAAKFWMDKGVAGLRLDAIKHIYQNERGIENLKLLKQFYTDLAKDYPDIYMVGEVLSGADDTAPFMAAIPSLFHFDAWWKLHGDMMQWGAKYYAKDMQEAYNKFKGMNPMFNAAIKLSNHDEDRALSVLEGDVEFAKIAATAIMTTPGQPYIYYGEEVGMQNTKMNGDEAVREPILWGDEYTTEWRANTNPPATVADQLKDPNSLLSFYKEITAVRKSTPALQRGVFTVIPWENLPQSMMAWYRSLGNKRVYVFMNASKTAISHTVDYDLTDVKELLNYNSASVSANGTTSVITLPENSIIIIEKTL